MRIAFVWDKNERKLQPEHYSQSYRGMFNALREKCDSLIDIHESCDAKDIDADVILFFDIHSSHHIIINGLKSHHAIKYEYFDDPHQTEHSGVWQDTKLTFHKLGPKQRMDRARERGIDFIVCPYKEEFLHYLYPFIYKGCHITTFPVVPAIGLFKNRDNKWSNRKGDVILTSGSTISDNGEYDFRIWCNKELYKLGLAYNPGVSGKQYPAELAKYKFGLAACTMPVPKYFEIALAGCLPIMQWNQNIWELGFRHGINCLYVSKNNFVDTVKYVISHTAEFELLAKNAQKLVEDNYTNEKFAKVMVEHIRRHLEHGPFNKNF